MAKDCKDFKCLNQIAQSYDDKYKTNKHISGMIVKLNTQRVLPEEKKDHSLIQSLKRLLD